MTPLQAFVQAMAQARKVFDADHSMAAWLVFYEAKQTAFANLVAALPQVKEVEDFWRYVHNTASTAWLPIVELMMIYVGRSTKQFKVATADRGKTQSH
jgi:hypothetical protein